MFKFHKIRGPEEMGDAVSTLEETANRLESMVQIAQKEKSRLHLLVGNVSERVDQINRSASSFDDTAQKIDKFKVACKNIESEIQNARGEVSKFKDIKGESTKLFEQFKQLKSQMNDTVSRLESYENTSKSMDSIVEKINHVNTTMYPEVQAISDKQSKLLEKFDDFVERLGKSELKLEEFAELSNDFKETSELVARESVRITTWVEATDKMSGKLDQASEVFETTRQKIDNLHELAEFVESKAKSLKKQKELLKKAHIESGRANGLFWEIKSKLSELEQDADKIRQMEIKTNEFDSSLKRIELRFEQINTFADKVENLIADYTRLDDYARDLVDHYKQLSVVNGLVKQLQKLINEARGEHDKLNKAGEQIMLFIKRSEESQIESRTLIRQMAEQIQNTQKFLHKAPDVNKTMRQIESIRKRAMALENKLMEAMATATEITDQSGKAEEIKKTVEAFQRDFDKQIEDKAREIAIIKNSITGLENKIRSVQTSWVKVPDLMDKLAGIDKTQRSLAKTYKSLQSHEQTALGLKDLMEQNNKSFKEFEKTTAEINQKASDIFKTKSELEKIEYKVKALSSSSQQLTLMATRIEKTEKQMDSVAEKFGGMNQQVTDWQNQSESIQAECDKIGKTHDDLRTNIGDVMDLFSKLSNLQTQAEAKAEKLTAYFDQAEQKIKGLDEQSDLSMKQSGQQIEKLGEIKDSIKALSTTQAELTERFTGIEIESAKIANLAGTIEDRKAEMASMTEKIQVLEGKLKAAGSIPARLDTFETRFKNLDGQMKNVSMTFTKMEKTRKEFDGYYNTLTGLESKIKSLAEKADNIDKLKADIRSASLIANELKARRKSLDDEESLINKAITAASKLEELVYRAEHINKEGK
ncbi:MAG: hypothetical protein GY839_13400 [candidate division Zixibacteria bacterium]|nr:hypothetical protein [candidate division Zixibacteria bacterium]